MDPATFTPVQEANISYVLFGINGLLCIVSTLLSVVGFFRRKPNIDITLQDYAKKSDLVRLDERIDDVSRQLFDRQRDDTHIITDKIDALSSRIHVWQSGMERQLGRLEGLSHKE